MRYDLSATECIRRWENEGGRLLVRWSAPAVRREREEKRTIRNSGQWIHEQQSEQALYERSR
jgi:hypothetical protein